MKVCYIVGAGDFTPRGLAPGEGDLLIAADGGYEYLRAQGLQPDLLLGDFDSLEKVPAGMETVRFPAEKDDTDMGLAVAEGIARGCTEFRIYGGSGDRPDHFFANLQLLCGLSRQGMAGALVCPGFDVRAVTDGTLLLPPAAKGTVFSVFAFGGAAEGVSIRGGKYALEGVTVECTGSLGVSNEFLDGEVSVSVARGTLMVFSYGV